MRIAAFLISLVLAACTTPYQSMGLRGGVEVEKTGQDTFRITSKGNGFTSRQIVHEHLLLKAAEIAREANATHFVIVSSEDTSAPNYTSGGVNIPFPVKKADIRLLKLSPGQKPPAGAYSGQQIIETIGRRV